MKEHDPGLIGAAIALATSILETRFSGAMCGFVAGSIPRGEGTILSDIDLVVIYEKLDSAWRESFVEGGFPVEVFVHDPETLGQFFDRDVDLGRPVIVNMIAEGKVIGRGVSLANELRARASAILEAGPRPLEKLQIDALRYEITDLLDDLRGKRSPAEMRGIGATLYQPLADLMLLGRGTWTGRGKWVPRLIGELNPNLLCAFDEAFRCLSDGLSDNIIAFARSELDRHGGPLFAGDKRLASRRI